MTRAPFFPCRIAVLALLIVMSPQSASALPAFARKYQTSCGTCHVVAPKLNPFGIAFRNNGYRIPPDDAEFVKVPDVDLGAPAWKTMWPNAVWPGSMPSVPPLSVTILADASVRPSAPVNVNLDFPTAIGAAFSGTSGDSVSFFASLSVAGATNAIAIDRAYAQFKLMPESAGQNWLVLKLGRIDTRAEPFLSLAKRGTGQQLNVLAYQAVPNGFRLGGRDSGAELWGAATGPNDQGGFEYGVGVVQGTAGRPEDNNFKDYYGAASYKFGGYGVVGPRSSASEPDQLNPAGVQSEVSFTVGGFAYKGKGQPATPAGTREDSFTRTGVKVDAWLKNLNTYAAYVRGRDNLFGTFGSRGIESKAFMIEADYLALPWVMPAVRYERTTYSDGRPGVTQWIPAVNLLARANVRLLVEGRLFNRVNGPGTPRTGLNEAVVRTTVQF